MSTSAFEGWNEKEKAKCFETIGSMFYNRNFGRLSKSDLEVLMFSLLLEHCRENGLDESDYALAVQLGITESRVRALKVKKELQYPSTENFDWKHQFMRSIKNGRYDDTKKLLVLSLSDPNVKREIEHRIEVNGWYHESQLNAKLLQMPVDQFIALCEQLGSEIEGREMVFDKEAFIAGIKASPTNEIMRDKGLWEQYKDADIREALPAILKSCGRDAIKIALDCIPVPGFARDGFKMLIDKM